MPEEPYIFSSLLMRNASVNSLVASLAVPLSLTQTIEGFTVSIHYAYADAMRVLLFCIIEPVDKLWEPSLVEQRRFAPDSPHHGPIRTELKYRTQLSDEQGNIHKSNGGSYDLDGNIRQAAFSFPMPEIGTKTTGRLRFTLNIAREVPAPEDPRLKEAENNPNSIMPGYINSRGQRFNPIPPTMDELVAGPFVYDFNVPVVPVRHLSTPISAIAADTELVLSNFVVTPSLVHFTIHQTARADEIIFPNFQSTILSVGDWSSKENGFNGAGGGNADGGITYNWKINVYDKQGEWELRIGEVEAVELDRHWDEWAIPGNNWQPPARRKIIGPWVFRFTLPPAAAAAS